MSKVDLILSAAAQRGKAKQARERASVQPKDALRLALLGLCMFVAGLVLLSQPQVIDWLDGAFQAASSQVLAATN
ncbi:hypothetical protein FGK63_09105 [Ruegeria sediminis]|uniref:Uncharacterized protein n=1 Tax=Ruegeria sediminis TaxID=2583820 RepID=A0ABY2WXM6_9RHOB|nr:hypothetical protein [Ruegeria sediminis]TMV07616.1 hypothetical protein FGK63_09105 [Ruegeria sediminis]